MTMETKNYREQLKNLVGTIIDDITKMVKSIPEKYLQLQDVRGNLIINHIDDQTCETIMSVTIKDFGGSRGESTIAWYGQHDEDSYLLLEHLNTDLLINVYESVVKEMNEYSRINN
jgi:hypothetical protein